MYPHKYDGIIMLILFTLLLMMAIYVGHRTTAILTRETQEVLYFAIS